MKKCKRRIKKQKSPPLNKQSSTKEQKEKFFRKGVEISIKHLREEIGEIPFSTFPLDKLIKELSIRFPIPKKELVRMVYASRIKPEHRYKMACNIDEMHTARKLQIYLYNALLKYEGYGVEIH